MVQESIVDYINSQIKLGVPRDTIKATLTGAGWVAADVEDTLKKVEDAKGASPISAISATPAASSSTTAKPVESIISPRVVTSVGATSPEQQTIKVSDLVSAAPASVVAPATAAKPTTTPATTTVTTTTTKSTMSKSPLTGPAVSKPFFEPKSAAANTFKATSYPGMKPHKSYGSLVTEIVLAIIIIAVGVFAGFLYTQNNSLNSKLSTLNGQSASVNSQLSALQSQITASTTALTAQVSSLTGENQELQTELSFYAAPSSTVRGATSTIAINGTVSGGGKASYAITTEYGAKVYVANSKVANVAAALVPLLATAGGTTATSTTPATPAVPAQFSGIYVPGSDTITLTAVNGTTL